MDRARTALERELQRRDAILEASRVATERFLAQPRDWQAQLPEVLATLGAAAQVSRVWISENFEDASGTLFSHQIEEWDAEDISRQQDDPQLAAYPYEAGGFGRWREVLSRGDIISGLVADLPPAEHRLFSAQGVKSIVGVPVFSDGAWWGILGFDDCVTERSWSDEELAALRTAATVIGVVIGVQRTEEQLQERESQYRRVFDASVDGLAITDSAGRIVETNRAFRAMHGYRADELAGRDLQLCLADLEPPSEDPVGSGSRRRARAVRRDGSDFPVEVRSTEFQFHSEPHSLTIVRDVSEREVALDLLERRVTALAQVAANLVVDQSLESTMRSIARVVVEASSGVAMALHLLDTADPDATMVVTQGLPTGYEQALMEAWSLGADSPAALALLDQGVKFIPDARQRSLSTPRTAPVHRFLRDVPWEGILSVPLDSLGRSLGALHVYYLPDHAPAADEIAFLSAIADQAAVAVENARLLDEGRHSAALVERQRLARELHDSVSQALFSMTLHARTAQLALAAEGIAPSGPLPRAVNQLRELTQAALAEMRALIFELRPGALTEEGLVSALDKQAAALTGREGLPISVRGPSERVKVAPTVEEHLYRMVLEALHNAVRHAGASAASVSVTELDGVIEVMIQDDGRGFRPEDTYLGHLGLSTMRDRATATGADLRIESAPGQGTTVTIKLPSATAAATPEEE